MVVGCGGRFSSKVLVVRTYDILLTTVLAAKTYNL